jgi:hypothetical protein
VSDRTGRLDLLHGSASRASKSATLDYDAHRLATLRCMQSGCVHQQETSGAPGLSVQMVAERHPGLPSDRPELRRNGVRIYRWNDGIAWTPGARWRFFTAPPTRSLGQVLAELASAIERGLTCGEAAAAVGIPPVAAGGIAAICAAYPTAALQVQAIRNYLASL